MRTLAALVFCAAVLSACRGAEETADANSGDAINADDVSIYDIQNPDLRVAIGAEVKVRGVVVVAIDNYGNKKGNLYVEEPGGGAYSGVLVFGALTTDLAGLAPGDLVDITGAKKDEFALTGMGGDPTARKTTELSPLNSPGNVDVKKTGTGAVPAPAAVDAAAIAAMAPADQDVEWEKWEGVLITVSSVSATGNVQQIGSSSGTPDPTFQKFPVTGAAYVESSMAAFPTPAPKTGDCFASVTGIGDYFFDWLILPRTTADITGGGTGCPALPSATVAQVQMGQKTGAVQIDSAYITAVTNNKSNLYIQDALQAAPYNGIFIFRGNSQVPDVPADVVPGAKVKVTGSVSTYMGLTEIKDPTITVLNPPGAAATPITGLTLAQITGSSAQYVGALVQVSNVKVTQVIAPNLPTDPTQHIIVTQGGMTIRLDDTVYRATASVNDCWATLTGIVHLNTFDTPPTLTLLPTKAGDITTGGTCN